MRIIFETNNKILAAEKILQLLELKTIFGFNGQMGSGKTTLISEVLILLEMQFVNSPTYAIANRYTIGHQQIFLDKKITNINHIDLYRLQSEEEIESSGFWDYFQDSESVLFVEWIERVQVEAIPFDWNYIQVEIVMNAESQRKYTFSSLS